MGGVEVLEVLDGIARLARDEATAVGGLLHEKTTAVRRRQDVSLEAGLVEGREAATADQTVVGPRDTAQLGICLPRRLLSMLAGLGRRFRLRRSRATGLLNIVSGEGSQLTF